MTYEILFERYQQGRISQAMLRIYVKKGVITQEEYQSIIDGVPIEQYNYLRGREMESIVSAIIGAAGGILVCIINNNTVRAKTQCEIQMQVQQINSTNEKNTAIITERLSMLTEQVLKNNEEQHDLIKRMYDVENEIERHGDRLDRLESN